MEINIMLLLKLFFNQAKIKRGHFYLVGKVLAVIEIAAPTWQALCQLT